MSRILTIGFEFREIFYYSLVRVTELAEETEYKITVMNGRLEIMLAGNNIIREKNGELNIEMSEHGNPEELKFVIAEALSVLLQIPLHKKLKTL